MLRSLGIGDVLVKGPWYRWAFESIRHDRFGIRNRVERFFRYLKERTAVLFLQPIHATLSGCKGEVTKMLIWTLRKIVDEIYRAMSLAVLLAIPSFPAHDLYISIGMFLDGRP